MEYLVLQEIVNQVKNNRTVAMVIITDSEDSTPRGSGSIMAVFQDGSTFGTIGGGNLEYSVIKSAKECIRTGEDKNYFYDLSDEGNLDMQCGGKTNVFIKVFKPKYKLLIVGGGHIAFTLCKLGKVLGFNVTIFDDRKEYCNMERFPQADELIVGDIEEKLNEYDIDNNCYIVIVTHGHKYDEVALKTVIKRNAAYIGMIGSKKKNEHIKSNLINEGIDEKLLNQIYAPIGINFGGETPEYIAFSIMAEILAVQGNSNLAHFKDL